MVSQEAAALDPADPSPEIESARTRACISANVSSAAPSTAARTSTSREGAARREAWSDAIVDDPRRPGVCGERRKLRGAVSTKRVC